MSLESKIKSAQQAILAIQRMVDGVTVVVRGATFAIILYQVSNGSSHASSGTEISIALTVFTLGLLIGLWAMLMK